MRYLIYVPGYKPFFTNDFNLDDHFSDGMVVFDTNYDKYTTDGTNWYEIPHDHL